jgi:hypothetical protein
MGEYNIKMDITELGWKEVDWIHMDQVGLVAPSFERDKEPSVSMQDGGMS